MCPTTAAEVTVDVHRATACRDPRGHPASQQSDGGIRVGGAQRLGFRLLCQENDPLGHSSRLFDGIHLQYFGSPES